MIIQLQIISIALLVAIATALPGVFLLVRGLSLMSDALSHALLLGIVGMFLIVKKLNSPLLMVGAVCSGLLTVIATQWLIQSKFLKKDAAIGLVFPLFFSLGIILICRYARSVHIDTDMVLLGDLVFAPFNRLIIAGYDIGPYAFWLMLAVVLTNACCIFIFYKELVMSSFDEQFAQAQGYYPTVLYYLLMTMTSVTSVAAFDIAGSIMVVALMITPPATAYLWARTMQRIIAITLLISFLSVVLGYWCASMINASIIGCIAVASGILFIGSLLYNRKAKRRGADDGNARVFIICYYLYQHGTQKYDVLLKTVEKSFEWQQALCAVYLKKAVDKGYIIHENNVCILTEPGKKLFTDKR